MSVSKVAYVDSSALVKLAVVEPESAALRRYLGGRRLVTSALARTEVVRALLPFGTTALSRGEQVLRGIDTMRVGDIVLRRAGLLPPAELRSLDAIHLATALLLGRDLGVVVTYDTRMTSAARGLKMHVAAPR